MKIIVDKQGTAMSYTVYSSGYGSLHGMFIAAEIKTGGKAICAIPDISDDTANAPLQAPVSAARIRQNN